MSNPPIEDMNEGYLCPECKSEVEQSNPQDVVTAYGTLSIESYYCIGCGWSYDDVTWPEEIKSLLDKE